MDYFPALNGLRGWAFLNVVLEHYTRIGHVLYIPFGTFGINLFYSLSAFLLTLQLYSKAKNNETMNVKSYFTRRIFRIYPLFTLAILLDYYQGYWMSYSDCVFSYILLIPKHIYWTIYVEMRFYAILPIVVLIFANIKRSCLKILLIKFLSVGSGYFYYYQIYIKKIDLRWIPYEVYDILYQNIVFLNYFPVFFLGCFAAIIYNDFLKDKEFDKGIQLYIGILSFILVFFQVLLFLYSIVSKYFLDFPIYFPGYNAASVLCYMNFLLLLLLSIGKNFNNKMLEGGFLNFFGDISYPGYLFHISIADIINDNTKLKYGDPNLIILSFFITIIVSLILHLTIEEYFVKISKGFFEVGSNQKNIITKETNNSVSEENTSFKISDPEI